MATQEEYNKKNSEAVVKRTNDYIELWDLPSGAGKRILQGIMKKLGTMKSPYSGSGQDMARKVGKLEVGMEIMEEITMAGIDITIRECMGYTEKDIENKFNNHLNVVKNKGRTE
jgi:hypothetical protein